MTGKRIRTHYDNLKVARDAPPEVIRAAYKALSQRFHPDKNPGDERAAKIMAIVNTSYAVLSDPRTRAAHDTWIVDQEGMRNPSTPRPDAHDKPSHSPEAQRRIPNQSRLATAISVVGRTLVYGFWGSMIIGFLYVVFSEHEPKPSNLPAYNANPAQRSEPVAKERDIYMRPPFAPNGSPWPTRAAYVDGYPKLHTDGLSTVTVDNSSNDSDVILKLVSVQSDSTFPIRQFFIPAYGKMRLNSVRAGQYEIRYLDLTSGHLSRSELFDLEEIEDANGVQFSNLTLTLYKVANGNFQMHSLRPDEF